MLENLVFKNIKIFLMAANIHALLEAMPGFDLDYVKKCFLASSC